MEPKLTELQKDLQDGMELFKALNKHNVTLSYALEHMDKNIGRPPARQRRKERYIRKSHAYSIYKWVEGKHTCFGTYDTMNDAIKVRNQLIKQGWDKRKLNNICEELGITRRRPGR